VKVTLRFRGREMQHTEFGFEVVKKFVALLETYGHPDFPPKMIGRGINMMMSPLPRNKRAKNPRTIEDKAAKVKHADEPADDDDDERDQAPTKPAKANRKVMPPAAESEVSEIVPPSNP
jgi:translation initiation factor IF-3